MNRVIYDALAYKVKDADIIIQKKRRFNPSYKWDGVKSFFDRRRRRFHTGFLAKVLSALREDGLNPEIIDRRLFPAPSMPVSLHGIVLRDYQERTIKEFLKAKRGVAHLATGAGKCLAKSTKVLMFDGSLKAVEDVKVGDLLMGDDSTPRKVLSLAHGTEEMFKVLPTKGEPYVVNRSHILSLKMTTMRKNIKYPSQNYRTISGEKFYCGDIVDISIDDYLALPKHTKHVLKGFRVPVEFEAREVDIDPYFLGAWLGDGKSSDITICTPETEIVEYLKKYAVELGFSLTKYPEPSMADSYHLKQSGNGNKLKQALEKLNLLGNKHIPETFKINSKKVRLKVLAGLLDTDGHLSKGYFEITTKHERLADDIVFLARSLGFAAYKKEKIATIKKLGFKGLYYRISISGDVDQIPTIVERKRALPRKQKKDVLATGIKVESIGKGEYFGFEIDGNKRFILGDFTVTHNTECAIAVTKALAQPTLFLTHRVNLLHQTAKRFAKRLPELKGHIGFIGDGQYEPSFITIATVQTLHSMIKRHPKVARELLAQFKVLIIDEAHRSGSKQFHETAMLCANASYRLALTATPFMKGNVEEDMWLLGSVGPVVTHVSNGELIERGILARPYFKFVKVNTPLPGKYRHWRDVYEHGIVKNKERNLQIVSQTRKLVDMGHKTLVIVLEVAHGQILQQVMEDVGIKVAYMDGKNSYAEREKALKLLEKGKKDVIIATNIFDEGVDVNSLSAVVLAAGTKSAPALFQRTGRAIRKKEKDNFAIVVDFIDLHHPKLMEHSARRYQMVKSEKGFVIL
jgi:superfamily II DNA or RNA helicase